MSMKDNQWFRIPNVTEPMVLEQQGAMHVRVHAPEKTL